MVLDLRGLLCPVTWARTRYALGRLQRGGELRVLLDHRPAVPDIKRNAEELGHEVVSTRESGEGSWEMLYRAAQAMAFLDGRTFTTPEDFKQLAVPVFAHRVVVNARYSSTLKKSDQTEQILRDIVESVAVPV